MPACYLMNVVFLLSVTWMIFQSFPCEAVIPANRLNIGWGVNMEDSTQQDIVEVISEYLTAPDSTTRALGTSLWLSSEQEKLEQFDLSGPWVYKGANATVLEVTPCSPDSSQYWVKTMFSAVGENGVQPFGIQRLLVQLEQGRWVLGGALYETTRGWSKQEEDKIVYHYPSSWVFDQDKADLADKFVESIYEMFDFRSNKKIDYYLSSSPEEMAKIIGLDWCIPGVQGRTYAADSLIFVGNQQQGEAYLHELVHVILDPFQPVDGWHIVISEGVASWLGGSRGLSYEELVVELREYQKSHPDIPFGEYLESTVHRSTVGYNVGAMLLNAFFNSGGIDSVKRALAKGTTSESIFELLKIELGVSGDSVEQWFRSEIN